jgi:hypothetical protein
MVIEFSTTQGSYAKNDDAVTSSLATRFDTSRLYISHLVKLRGDSTKPVGPDFTNINEISCSFTSSKTGRLFTECCTTHEQCKSGNCYMNEYCSDTCKFPPWWFNDLYLPNGSCCIEDRECVSQFCHMGTCALKCFH